VEAVIRQENISGGIFIKDADCTFKAEVTSTNGVAVYPLEKLTFVNPQHKSYVAIDDNYYITNIIEKRVIARFFSAGGYAFESAKTYSEYYERYKDMDGLYLSHIIYSMLLDKHIFRPIQIEDYKDLELENR